jgi:hypothetical protein
MSPNESCGVAYRVAVELFANNWRPDVDGNVFGYNIHMAPRLPLGTRIHHHVSAARAFHTDLIAGTHRALRVLANLARHLNTLRSQESSLAERLDAAESSRVEVEKLEELRRSSLSTHRDLRQAFKRIHHHLNRMAAGQRDSPNRTRSDPATDPG